MNAEFVYDAGDARLPATRPHKVVGAPFFEVANAEEWRLLETLMTVCTRQLTFCLLTAVVCGCTNDADTGDATPADPVVGSWAASSLTYEDGSVETQPEGDAAFNGQTYEEMAIDADLTGRHISVEIEEDGDEEDGLYVERGTYPLTVTTAEASAYAIAVVPYANGRMDMDCTLTGDTLSCTTDQQIDGFFEVTASTWVRVDALSSDSLTVDEEF